jgi:hypothetical protein
MIPPPPKGAPAADQEFGLSIFRKIPSRNGPGLSPWGRRSGGGFAPESVMSKVKQFIWMIPPLPKSFVPTDQGLDLSFYEKFPPPDRPGLSP